VGSVDAGHELAVRCAGGGEVPVVFGELQAQVDGLLLEPGDLLVEGVDIVRFAEPGLAPGVFAEGVGEPMFEVLDAGVETGGTFVGGEQVGLQRGPGDRRADTLAGGGRLGGESVDLSEQVAVAVEEAAVDPAARAMADTLISAPSAAVRSSAVRTRCRRRALSAWRPSRIACARVPGGAAVAARLLVVAVVVVTRWPPRRSAVRVRRPGWWAGRAQRGGRRGGGAPR
jgi:hypothetical protein